MKKINNITLFLLVLATFQLSAQKLDWVKFDNGSSGIRFHSTDIDNQNNVYNAGVFSGTGDFDFGAGVNSLTSVSNSDMFVQKINSSGNLIWAKAFSPFTSSTGRVTSAFIQVDSQGNTFVAGTFTGTVNFDPSGVSIYTLTTSGSSNLFLLKLDVNGDFIFAKQLVGITLTDFALTSNNDIILTGVYYATTDFDPNAGIFNLVSLGTSDNYLLKLNQAGNFIWAKNYQRSISSGSCYIVNIATDNSGNVYLGGQYAGVVDFDSGTSTYTLSTFNGNNNPNQGWISKIDPSGNFLWAKSIGTIVSFNANNWTYMHRLHVDPSGNMWIKGEYAGTQDFDPSSNVNNLVSPGVRHYYIAHYDQNGSFLWAKNGGVQSGGVSGATYFDFSVKSIRSDLFGNSYYFGFYTGVTIDLDPSTASYILTPVGNTDSFLQKIDSLGNFDWAFNIGGLNNEESMTLAINNSGYVHLSGIASSGTDFDPSTSASATPTISSTYLLKLQNCTHDAPNICLVTVDSLAQNNVIYWDKTVYPSADTFIVYRYDAFTTNYLRVGAKAVNQQNFLIDTARTIGGPNGGNPQYSSYRYKLAIKDVCGTTGTKGLYHESIFIQQNNQNFSWNAYGIEGQTSPATGYQFMRDNTNIGNWQVLVNTGGLSTTDPNYASYPNGNWRVDALGFSCNPTTKLNPNAAVNKSKSNVKNNFVVTSANALELKANVLLSPNPAKTELTVTFSNHQQTKTEFIITDVLGKVVSRVETLELNKIIIPLNDISPGVYFLNIKQGKLQTTKKFVKE